MITGFQAGVMATGRQLWTPANITTFQWFDAADTTTLPNSGNTLTGWNDKSGNARHITYIFGTPTTNTRTLNSLNVVDFNGLSYVGEAFKYATTTNRGHALMVVASDQTTFSDGGSARFANIGFNGTDNRLYAGVGTADTTYLLSNRVSTRLGFSDLNDDIQASSTITTDPFILHFGRGYQTGGVLYINGTLQGSDNSISNTNDVTLASLQMGGDGGSKLNGLVAEMIKVTDIDTTTRQKIEGYLAHKWGLTASLPSDHPYKSAAPTV